MKLYLTDQRSKFRKHLDFLKTKKVMGYDKILLTEKTSTIDLATSLTIQQLNLDILFAYQIFPEHIMTCKTQWLEEGRKMQVGDTIVQQVYIPPTKVFSKKLIFGVRISEIIDEDHRKGFSYETLEGHVEKGISTFTVEQLSSGLIFKIQTYSSPGNILTTLLGPIFAVPYQNFCTKAALKNVAGRLTLT